MEVHPAAGCRRGGSRAGLILATAALAALCAAGGARDAAASHNTVLADVDFIDQVFGIGGGSYTKSLTGGADDGWSVFAANAGDTITVSFAASGGIFDGAVLLEVNDGIVAVQDLANVANFSFNRLGAGTDLQVQHMGFDLAGGYSFGPSASGSVTLNNVVAGQYAIGVSCSDELCTPGSTFTVSLKGNSAAVAVPAPAALAIFVLGVGLLGLRRACQRPSP